MATIFVDSNAAGANDGTTEADAYTTMQGGLTSWTTSDEIHVSKAHNEGTASVTLTATNATVSDRVPIYRIDFATDAYDATTGADTKNLNISSANADITVSFSGAWHGMYLYAADNIVQTAAGRSSYYKDCKFEVDSANAYFSMGSSNSDHTIDYVSCTFDLNHTSGGYINGIGGSFNFTYCTFEGTIDANGLVRPSSTKNTYLNFTGCDFSGATHESSAPLVDMSSASDATVIVNFIACDVVSGVAYHDSTFGTDNQFVYVHNTDNAGATYITDRYGLRGDVTTDTGVYFTGTDQYQDADGTTAMSHKMVTASNVDVASALHSLDMYARIDSTGSKTFTVEVVENFTSALTKRECWIEVMYLGGASETLWSMAEDREFVETSYTNLAAGAGLASWTGEPGGSRSAKVTATATVNQTGVFKVRLMLANYESTKVLYYNPAVTVT